MLENIVHIKWNVFNVNDLSCLITISHIQNFVPYQEVQSKRTKIREARLLPEM
jgi:hypothetical protein